MKFNNEVQHALRHVNSVFPEVTQVFFGEDARWLYCGKAFESPDFSKGNSEIDTELLEAAADSAAQEYGLPCAIGLITLDDLYELWRELAAVPVQTVDKQAAIAGAFLHFEAGTTMQSIVDWFELVNPEFCVDEANSRYGGWVLQDPLVNVRLSSNTYEWHQWNISQNLTDRWGNINYFRRSQKPLKSLQDDAELFERLLAQMWDEITFIVRKDGAYGLLFEVEHISRESESDLDPLGCENLDPHVKVLSRLFEGIARLEKAFPGVEFAIPQETEIPESRPAVWAFVADGCLSEEDRENLGRALLRL